MPCIDLNHTIPGQLQQQLVSHSTIVACLCADWCDVCKGYRAGFEALAQEYPAHLFLWIDIEDQGGLVDHLDVDNFPTILIQQNDIVSFYGTMQADPARLKRQINTLSDKSVEQLQAFANSGELQRQWQQDANIRNRIRDHV